ncbi:TetR/AcrR family transcriptional regulator [Mycolicibacterium fluoranthenivorans]|uniref:AcrR family transcriptional regulator n=1 Tax=Mycolicibacterium fluoranthenivorans TaxID=258505 RepID=A0A7X5U4Q9_9MYCO|nr:TetR/AcrR family transcriptional regulator [Mycolicibacterium fluoranthenivorans]NIH98401.1 AcrR family transcriptional regulator [Mycolicibacterium fluoranthenivorans]
MTSTTSTTTPPSVRDRLIDAAEVCLRAKGIRATTVSEVAEGAGVSRGWLYRHFPDKVTLLGAAIVRLNEAYWSEAHAVLEQVEGLDQQIAAGIRHGRTAYDDPGALLMKLRIDEPDEFAACAGAGVQGLVPDLASFWSRYLIAAREKGEIHPDVIIAEASEWVARVVISLATVPGDTLDPGDSNQLLTHIRRYLMPALRSAPA